MSQRRIHLHAIAATAALLVICLVALSRSNPLRAEESRKEMDFHKNPADAKCREHTWMHRIRCPADRAQPEARDFRRAA
jgi:hypothetical protein